MEMIVNCRFERGTRLNVEQLARDMEISRTPLWEAVNRLIQEDLDFIRGRTGPTLMNFQPLRWLELEKRR